MVTTRVTLDFPVSLPDSAGGAEEIAVLAKQALVLTLLRDQHISQGKAAELLGIDRWAMMTLAAEAKIVSGPLGAAEVDEEIESARRIAPGRRSPTAVR